MFPLTSWLDFVLVVYNHLAPSTLKNSLERRAACASMLMEWAVTEYRDNDPAVPPSTAHAQSHPDDVTFIVKALLLFPS